jgi:hypothetical protein
MILGKKYLNISYTYWEYRSDSAGATEQVSEYKFFCGKRNDNFELGAGYFPCTRIIGVTRVMIVADRMSYILLSDRWCDSFVLNVHA